MRKSRLLPSLEPSERSRFYAASVAFICVASGALFARAAGDALFLSRLGSDPLPFMYLGGALATGIGAWLCARASLRLHVARVAIRVSILLAAAGLGIFALLDSIPRLASVAAYLLADLTGRLPVLLFWALATELFDSRQSRRLFGIVGAAGTAACLPAGLLAGPLAQRFGTGSLTFVAAALLAGSTLAISALLREGTPDWPPRAAGGRSVLAPASTQSSGHLHGTLPFITISALAAVTSIVQTLIDWQFKATYAPLSDSGALAGLFGGLYALTSTVALFIQLFLVHRVLQGGGPLLSLALLPAGVILTSLAALFTGAPSWVYATKALDVTLTLTIYGTARHLLYRGIRKESRVQARAIAEGLYQPLAVGFTGAALALVIGIHTTAATGSAIILGCLVWLALARGACGAYLAGLLASIQRRTFESDDEPLASADPALAAWVRQSLTGGRDEEVIYLAGILHDLGDFSEAPELIAALDRNSPRVKVAILDFLREHGRPGSMPAIERLSSHGDPDVRRAAVMAASALGGAPWLHERLSDPETRVRAAAAVGLSVSGDAADAAAARAALDDLSRSKSPHDVAAVAEALAAARAPGAAERLARLLHEREDEEVLLPVLDACLAHPDPALVSGLLPLLARPRLAGPASEALVAVGAEALDPIASWLAGPPPVADPAALRRLPPLLARIGDMRALPLLRDMLSLAAPADRRTLFEAIADLVRRQKDPAGHFADVDAFIRRESRSAEVRLRSLERLGDSPATELAREATGDLLVAHVRNVFLLLRARLPGVDIDALDASFREGGREARSQGLEVLENVLPDHLKQPLLDVLDAIGRPGAMPRADSGDAIHSLLKDVGSEWVVAGALYAVAHFETRGLAGDVRDLLAHDSPVVRETALHAMSRLVAGEALREACRPLAEDPDGAVRDLARSLGALPEPGGQG